MNTRTKNNYNVRASYIKDMEERKCNTIVLIVSLQARDQSNKTVIKASTNCLSNFATSSKIRWLRSCHTVHIRHKGTKYRKSASPTYYALFAMPVSVANWLKNLQLEFLYLEFEGKA